MAQELGHIRPKISCPIPQMMGRCWRWRGHLAIVPLLHLPGGKPTWVGVGTGNEHFLQTSLEYPTYLYTVYRQMWRYCHRHAHIWYIFYMYIYINLYIGGTSIDTRLYVFVHVGSVHAVRFASRGHWIMFVPLALHMAQTFARRSAKWSTLTARRPWRMWSSPWAWTKSRPPSPGRFRREDLLDLRR